MALPDGLMLKASMAGQGKKGRPALDERPRLWALNALYSL
jgi:hypothetical protein